MELEIQTGSRKTEKRLAKILENFFSTKQNESLPENAGTKAVLLLPPDELLKLLRMFRSHPNEMSILSKYASVHKQAVGELTVENVKDLHTYFQIKDTHES